MVVGFAAATLLAGMAVGVDVGLGGRLIGVVIRNKKASDTQDNGNTNSENAYLSYRLRFRGENDTKNPSVIADGMKSGQFKSERFIFSSAHHM